MMRRVACVQTYPIFLDSLATTDRVCGFIERAAKGEAELVVFPELIISGYPNFKILSLDYRIKYNDAAILVDGPEILQVSEKAAELGTVVVLGFIERDLDFPEVIYNSSCVIDSDGYVIGTHRKIAPLGAEKLMFKQGDARDIRIFETRVGKLGVGLCFEHLNPLYRKALSLLGEEIHCALWVNSEDIRHVVESSSRVTAIEGGAFVALASQITPRSKKEPLAMGQDFIGGSGVLTPWGKFISGPKYGSEEIIYADIEPETWRVQKYQSRGIEARDDLLSLNLAKEAYKPIREKKERKS